MSKGQGYIREPKVKKIFRLLMLLIIFIIAGLGYSIQHNLDESTTTIVPSESDSVITIEPVITQKPESKPQDSAVSEKNPNINVPELTVHFIDVGQADSILIQSGGEFMLVDGGNNADKDTVITYLKEQGVKKLEYVVATHPHEDHIGALDEVIEEFPVGKVFAPYVEHTSKTYYNLLEAVTLANLKMKQPEVGSEVTLGGSIVTFLSPNSDYGNDLNNWSVGLKVTNGVHTFVMCGDAEIQAESDIVANGIDIKADVLKLGHHGSSTASSDAFLDAVDPKYAIISCGADNSYGHPHTETLNRLKQHKIELFRTDLEGSIVMMSNGKEIVVRKN